MITTGRTQHWSATAAAAAGAEVQAVCRTAVCTDY